jgi:hypothetical protein
MAKTFEELLNWAWGKLDTIEQAKADGVCNICEEPILSFKDEKSRTEYDISALCQNCQDKLFTEDEDE